MDSSKSMHLDLAHGLTVVSRARAGTSKDKAWPVLRERLLAKYVHAVQFRLVQRAISRVTGVVAIQL